MMLAQDAQILEPQEYLWSHGIFLFKGAGLSFNFWFWHHQHGDTCLSRLAKWSADRSFLLMLFDCVKGCQIRAEAKLKKVCNWESCLKLLPEEGSLLATVSEFEGIVATPYRDLLEPLVKSGSGGSFTRCLLRRVLISNRIHKSHDLLFKSLLKTFKHLTPSFLEVANISLWTVINHFPDLFSAPAFDIVYCFWVLFFVFFLNWDGNLCSCLTLLECITE